MHSPGVAPLRTSAKPVAYRSRAVWCDTPEGVKERYVTIVSLKRLENGRYIVQGWAVS